MKSTLIILYTNFAQKIKIGDESGQVSGIGTQDADVILANTLNGFYFVAGAVAVVVLIVGGIMYTISGGNAASVTKAKGLVTYSIIGLIVVFIAFAITNFVRGIF